MITPELGYTDVKDGESPFYTNDSSSSPNSVSKGYYPDANTVAGLAAASFPSMDTVTSANPGPNNIVSTGSTGQLPASVIGFLSGTLAFLKANKPTSVALCFATDVGPSGSWYAYFNDASVGDSGFQLLSGS